MSVKSIKEICEIPLRDVQKKVLSQLNHGKINIIQAPTGTGKSFIAAHIAKNHRGAMIITPTRALQKQYIQEMKIENLWGKAHYKCKRYKTSCDLCDEHFSSETDRLSDEAKAKITKEHERQCEYKQAKAAFSNDKYGVSGVEICYFGIRNQSKCLIVDEAHNLIDKFTNLSGCKISSKSTLFGETFKALNHRFSKEEMGFEPFLNTCLQVVELNREDENSDRKERKASFIEKLKVIKENQRYFSYEIVFDKNSVPSVEIKKLNFRFEFAKLTENFDHVYLMSATLPDVPLFCRLLGIDKGDMNFINVESPFDPHKVKINCFTETDLSSRNYEKNIGRAVQILEEVLDGEYYRGVVHCTSFKQLNDIKNRIDTGYLGRLIFDDQGLDKSQLIELMQEAENKVLVSPSAHEGLDLKGALGIFSVTFKAPFPMWTPWIKAMSARYPTFYNSQAMARFIQGLGRCIRTFDDCATIYLIDRCCGRFIKSNKMPRNIRLARKNIIEEKKAA